MTRRVIDVGIAHAALPGENESGDRCVVKVFGNRALVGVIDGLGHGEDAHRAAAAAAEVLEAFGHEPVSALMARCHERLRETRGAAITLVAFDCAAGSLEWTGAGNVTAVLLRREPAGDPSRMQLLVRGGVAGGSLPSTTASTADVARGDIVAIATDGVRPGFIDGIKGGEPLQPLAERLLEQYQTAQDDALLAVIRVQG
jgi:phosphoserine phosphatase RsbX